MDQNQKQIVMASDHAGFRLKEHLKKVLETQGYEVLDQGPFNADSVDYPNYGLQLAKIVKEKQIRGVLVCGSGVGISIVGNKVAGVRVGLCHDQYTAKKAREEIDCNVIAFGDRVTGNEVAQHALDVFLNTKFLGTEQQLQKLKKLDEIEKRNLA